MNPRLLSAAGAAVVALLATTAPVAAEPGAEIARGKYLATIGLCGDCHTPGGLIGRHDMKRMFAGSEIAFAIPELGYFNPPNITPDDETGLGKWTREEIAAAITTGKRPDGRELVPIMPWRFYQHMTPDDAMAIATYLKSLAPIRNPVPGPRGAGEKAPGAYLTAVMP